MMTKVAEKLPELSDYQSKAISKSDENDGSLLIAHPMGSGKTRTSVEVVEHLRRHGKANITLAVVPSSLRSNYADNGVHKYTKSKATILGSTTEKYPDIYDKHLPKSDYYVVSYDMFKKDPHYYLDRTKADTMVVDEMHNFRNENTKNFQQMKSIRGRVKNFIGLTGTPFNNHPSDVRPLIDIVSNGDHGLGKNREEFMRRFTTKVGERETLKNTKELSGHMNKWMHYVNLERVQKNTSVPEKSVEDVEVEMSPLQKTQYDFVMRKVPDHVRRAIRDGMPVNRKEAFHILPMLTQARGVSNSINYVNNNIDPGAAAEHTPKVHQALNDIVSHLSESRHSQVIVHSHLVEGGTNIVAAGLKNRGIAHGVITGKISTLERDKIVKDYNCGKIKAIVLSSAGTTGLNLPNTTMHVALDSHYNPAVNDQIEARGIRAGGQAYRPENERKVIVRRYKTVYPHTIASRLGLTKKPRSVDQWIHSISNDKNEINNQAEKLLKSAAIEDLQKLAGSFYQSRSPISGTGNFASSAFVTREQVGMAMRKVDKSGKPDQDYTRSPLGKYTNHSDTPNLNIRKKGNNFYFHATKEIKPGDELTVNYDDFDFDGRKNFIKKESAEIVGYQYTKDGYSPENILNYSDDHQNEIVSNMEGRGQGYLRNRRLMDSRMYDLAKSKLGDSVKVKNPLYFRIGKDPNNWGGKDFKEYRLDNNLLSNSTFTIGDSFDNLRKFRRGTGSLKGKLETSMMTLEELKSVPKEDIDNHPNMKENKGGNYIEGQLWAPWKTDGNKIVLDKG